MLRGERWQVVSDFSGQPVGPRDEQSKKNDGFTLQNKVDRLSRNVGNQLTMYAALTTHKSEGFRNCRGIPMQYKIKMVKTSSYPNDKGKVHTRTDDEGSEREKTHISTLFFYPGR